MFCFFQIEPNTTAEHLIAATFIPESKLSMPWLDVFVDAGGKSRRLLRSVNLMYTDVHGDDFSCHQVPDSFPARTSVRDVGP